MLKLMDIMHFEKNPDYYITRSFCYFGVIKTLHTNEYFILGPASGTPVSDVTIQSFLREFSISQESASIVTALLSAASPTSFRQFLNILSFAYLCINQAPADTIAHFNSFAANQQKKVLESHSQNLYHAKEEQSFHTSYQFEQQYLNYVQNGEVEKLKKYLLDSSSILTEGILADNTLRQAKNIFIATITITTRAAISGGLDAEQTYYLSDNYIQEVEKLLHIDAIYTLLYAMLTDFTARVASQKIPAGMSREVFSCIQYISQHTNDSICVDDVADFINMSRSTITRRFKKELGFDISSFIKRCKLEEAKSLLSYTDKSLSEISSYLCFSSQSHFQTAFKKKYGMTPLQYRKRVWPG